MPIVDHFPNSTFRQSRLAQRRRGAIRIADSQGGRYEVADATRHSSGKDVRAAVAPDARALELRRTAVAPVREARPRIT